MDNMMDFLWKHPDVTAEELAFIATPVNEVKASLKEIFVS